MQEREDIKDRDKLSGLFRFAQGVLAARDQVILRMRDTGLGCFLESEMVDLPGLSLNLDEERWLVLQRLRESAPSLPEGDLVGWLDSRTDDPAKPPVFKPIQIIEVGIDEASDLCEADLLDIEEVFPVAADPSERAAKPEAVYRVTIALRLDRLDAIRASLEEWRSKVWEDWAGNERPVRRSIQLYNALFKLHNMLHGGVATTPPELVWGIGHARWQLPQGTIDMPLIEQLVDLEVQAQGALSIRPRDVGSAVVMKPFLHLDVEGAAETQRDVQALFRTITDGQDLEISPFDPVGWENLLDLVVSRLSDRGKHVTLENLRNGEVLKGPGSDLAVYSSWVIYGRARSENVREQDLERLRQQIDKAEDDVALPASMRGYVAPAPEKALDGDDWGLTRTNLGGQSAPWGDPGQGGPGASGERTRNVAPGKVYFFPLPYNEEQAKIIDRLEAEDVVTVTGPPGTGKTHTIANIIGHFMATGQRVLVTARTAEAIAAVRDKLPDELANLVIASVASDREGVKQLEDAIQRLSDDVVTLDVSETKDEIARLESEILEIEAEGRQCDQRLAEIAQQNLAPLLWSGEKRTAMEMAEIIAAMEPSHAWMTDRPAAAPPPALEEVISRLRISLPCIGQDLAYLGAELPDPSEIPPAVALIAAHKQERQYRTRPREDFTSEPMMARDTPDADAIAAACHEVVSSLRERLDSAERWERSITAAHLHSALRREPAPTPHIQVESVWGLIGHLSPGQIRYETNGQSIAALLEAAERGRAGKRVLPRLAKVFNSDLAAAVGSIQLNGIAPESQDHWSMIYDALKIEEARGQIEEHWIHEAAAERLPPLPAAPDELVMVVKTVRASLGTLTESLTEILQHVARLKQLFPYGIDIDTCLVSLDFDRILRALQANMKDAYVPPAALGKLDAIVARGEQPLFGELRLLRESLGQEGTTEANIVESRNLITQEIDRLRGMRDELDRIGRDLAAIQDAGAPNWAEACAINPANALTLNLFPENWRESWNWAMMRGRLDYIVALGNGNEWREKKMELTKRREQRFEQLIRARTLLGLKRRLTGPVQSALATFTAAIRRLGKGTGKTAGRWRKAIRQAAIDAAPAAPVWVMPEHKIAEQLPAELGDFNLVILDEASQSDVTAIAALARGKKHLIVGDEQQVSPTPVGIPQSKIDVLRATHIGALPNKDVIDEKTSIFDIAMQMYPKNHVMLREHFRCVEPIIQFSTRFYNDRLIPIRIPKPSERFDPPLVDVYVKGATRKGQTNEDEARFIIEEIATLANNPIHATRDIAVISLIGSEQAELIERRLMEDPRVGTETMERMRIVCGDSRTMQGQERSIVFLSMVATPDTAIAQSTREAGQRFNVALSRARDRLYLVRSVAREDLKPGDLKLAVIEHLANPMPEGRTYAGTSILDRCESGFEREFCERLLDANYRVRSQVKAGPYRIDLVVEGADDRRLAIELDGDRWHGPEKWDQDMMRQAALERAGWTFWRVFGSQWVSDRAHWWANLEERLRVMGIMPIGAETAEDIFTDFRVFDPSLGSVVHAKPSELQSYASSESEQVFEGLTAQKAIHNSDTPEVTVGITMDIPLQTTPETGAQQYGGVGPQSGITADGSRFYEDRYQDTLRSIVWEIVDREGPIVFRYLCERIARLHGFQRTGSEIKRTIQNALQRTRNQSHGKGEEAVIWPKDLPVSEWVSFRGLEVEGGTRLWADVPMPEKLGLARKILSENRVDPEAAIRESLGMTRLRATTRVEIQKLLEQVRLELASESASTQPASNVTYLKQRGG